MNDQSTIDGNGQDDPDLPTPKIPNYQLVKLIGQGSFGQVWIALDATNSPCALKIIHKRRTKEELFWKEFKGVQNYLPISRSNLGLVTILHVGVSEDDSFFYYTMELADNIHGDSQEKDWSSYEAKSLSSQIRSIADPYPLDQFHQISQNLSNGLAHLHKNGLVHRDIKPSNVIFVNGSAKLADVGLVTLGEDASTFIGTTGYIPPEGPGTPAGDVYALGKTLYEVLTGNSVQSFPSLPTLVGGTHPEEKLFAAFNLVISQACTPNYLERIKDGQSLQEALSEASKSPSIPSKNTKIKKKYFTIASLVLVICFFGYDFKLNNSGYSKFLRGELKNGYQTIRSLPELLESKLLNENKDGLIFGAEDPEQKSAEIPYSNIAEKLDNKSIEQEQYLPRHKPEELKLTEQTTGISERLGNEKLESNTHVVDLPDFDKPSITEVSTPPQSPLAELPAVVTNEIVPNETPPLQRQPVPQITERFLEPIKQTPIDLETKNEGQISDNSSSEDFLVKSEDSASSSTKTKVLVEKYDEQVVLNQKSNAKTAPSSKLTERLLEPIKQKPVGLIPESIAASSDDLIGEKPIARDSKSHESQKTDTLKVASPQKPKSTPTIGTPFVWEEMQLTMPWIPPGEFTMGSRESEIDREEDESPVLLLKISNGFWMSNVETTQYQYQMVTHSNPSKFKSSTSPVENVSWMNAKKFCDLITKVAHEELSLPKAYIFDLPTEQEWEYSCRAGTITAFSFGNSISQNLANFRDQNPPNNAHVPNSTTPVASYPPNLWNLYDMHGNVAEWTSTVYSPYLSSTKPKFPTSDTYKVVRGGNWTNYSKFCRSAYRNRFLPSFKSSGLGFRLVLRKINN